MELALNAGADDLQREDDVFEVTTDPARFTAVLEALKAAGIDPTESEVRYLSKMQKDLDIETGKKVVKFIDALDDHDDVQNVHTDANLTDEMGEG